ncbi:MAG: acyltransferase family protein [Helicobacteraceae bacterium]|nr:acyltransferase family protein [Helicobacteraceae bacterium]
MLINKSSENYLNFLRWIAAFFVVIGHLRSFLFINYHEVPTHTIFTKMFYLYTGFGHQGVIVFFIISGYLVGGAMTQKYLQHSITKVYLKLYIIKRFSRIYTVLVPALVIGLLLDSLGHVYFKELYEHTYHIYAMNFNAYERIDIFIFFNNLLNFQTITVNTLGTNGPLWSLAYEWWYYMLLPLLLINNISRGVFIGLIILLLFLNYNLLLYAFVWVLGSLVFLLNKKLLHSYISIFLFLCVLLVSRKISGIYIDFILAVSLSLVINSIKFSKDRTRNILDKFNSKMADFSYSVYLFHFPFIVCVVSILHFFNIDIILKEPSLWLFTIYILILVATYLYSYIMYIFFEKNTFRVKNYLLERWMNNET